MTILMKLINDDKPTIDTLTDIAKENLCNAEIVTRVIEERLDEVEPDKMLPIICLIDSICKNIGTPYVDLFQQNLVSNFSHVFQHVSKDVRKGLHKLRLSWRDSIFSGNILQELDTKLHAIDPAWP